jgi:hypothetical protein
MNKIRSWHIYFVLIVLLVVFDIWTTATNFVILNRIIKDKEELIGYKFLMLYTKVLHIMECYYFSALLVQKKISSIIQTRIVKVMCIIMSLTISCKVGFTAPNIIYFVTKIFSFLFLHVIFLDMVSEILQMYNKVISTDLSILKRYILYESIIGCKTVAYVFLGLLIPAHTSSEPIDKYFYYMIVKWFIFSVDKALSMGKLEKITYLYSSLFLVGALTVVSAMYVGYFYIENMVFRRLAYMFNELVLFLWFLFLTLFLYIERKNPKLINKI